jgi:choline-glycine betaine transporter
VWEGEVPIERIPSPSLNITLISIIGIVFCVVVCVCLWRWIRRKSRLSKR